VLPAGNEQPIHQEPQQKDGGVDPDCIEGDTGPVTAADAGIGGHHEAGDGPVGQDHGDAEGEPTSATAGDRESAPPGTTAARACEDQAVGGVQQSAARPARDDYRKLAVHTARFNDGSLLNQFKEECAGTLDEIDRLRRRDAAWAASVRWHGEWVTRAVNLLGSLRDDLEHELTESGHMEAVEQLLADEFEDGDADSCDEVQP
jgi:hypothetical protein